MPNRTITVTVGDRTLYGQIMRVDSTMLGVEDHGAMTAALTLKAKGTGVALSGWVLDTSPIHKGARREGSAYGLDYVMEVMRTVGVSSWEKVLGSHVIALFSSPSPWGSVIVGIANLDDPDLVFIPAEHSEWWKERGERDRHIGWDQGFTAADDWHEGGREGDVPTNPYPEEVAYENTAEDA